MGTQYRQLEAAANTKRSGGEHDGEKERATHYRQLDVIWEHCDETDVEKGGHPDFGQDSPGPWDVPKGTGVYWDDMSVLPLPTVAVEAAMRADVTYTRNVGYTRRWLRVTVRMGFECCPPSGSW